MRLVVVGCAPARFIEDFKETTGFRGDVFCDPTRQVYLQLGLRYGMFKDRKMSMHVKSSIIGGIFKSIKGAFKSLRKQGDFLQQGGSFILGPGEKVEFAHIDESPMDHAPINDLLDRLAMSRVDFSPPPPPECNS